MIYSPFNYHPTIYFIKKPASCVQEKPVSVMIAQDVDDCDDVAGWTGDDEAIMSEGEVKSTSDIVIFVGPSRRSTPSIVGGFDNPDDNIQFLPGQEGSITASERAPGDINLVTRQIKNGFRFERSNRSELAGNILNYTPGLTIDGIITSTFNMVKIHKDDINNSKTFIDVLTPYFNITPATQPNMMVVFYEHDWWASVERITNACHSPNFVRANMKYAHEFYANDCLPTASAWPLVGSTVNISNNKCSFVLTRIP